MSAATAVQETVTPWTTLAAVKRELARETESENALLRELSALADSVERAKKEADAADPLRWTAERAKFCELTTQHEAKRAEVSKQTGRCQAIVRRRDELLREVKKVEAQIGKAEREFDIARDAVEQCESTIRTARGSRLADLEAALPEKRKALAEKRAAVEAAWALRGDSVPGQSAKAPKGALVPSTMDKFMSASPENREIELEVRRLEREVNLLTGQIPTLERSFEAAEKKIDPFGSADAAPRSGSLSEDDRRASENFTSRLVVERQKSNKIFEELTTIRVRLAKVRAELEAVRTKRDEMLNEFSKAQPLK